MEIEIGLLLIFIIIIGFIIVSVIKKNIYIPNDLINTFKFKEVFKILSKHYYIFFIIIIFFIFVIIIVLYCDKFFLTKKNFIDTTEDENEDENEDANKIQMKMMINHIKNEYYY